jgi:putative hemolysin
MPANADDKNVTGFSPSKLLRFPRRRPSLSGTLFRAGELEVRLAEKKKEIRKAQRLRYEVFYEEGGAIADRTAALIRRDVCPFDRIADHLLVVDHSHRNRFGKPKPRIVGVYRLLRQEIAERNGGFYSEGEFDIAPLLARQKGKRFLELGRSCVAKSHRSKRTLELLWRGIGIYLRHYSVDAMIGCASFPGTDPAAHAGLLQFLREHRRSPEEWRAGALPDRDASHTVARAASLAPRTALAALPALIKGYMRCGATFGDGVVIDHQFGTTDVFVIMPVAEIDPRYLQHFDSTEAVKAA